MTILTITKKGTLRFPSAVIDHLHDAQHLQVRLNAHGITLTPVNIRAVADTKAIPESNSAQTQFPFAADARPEKSPRQK